MAATCGLGRGEGVGGSTYWHIPCRQISKMLFYNLNTASHNDFTRNCDRLYTVSVTACTENSVQVQQQPTLIGIERL